MLVPRRALNGRHSAISQCTRGAERKRRQIEEAETRESSGRAFEEYGEPLQNVSTFRYLGRVLTVGDDGWLAVVGKIGKARKSWGWLSWIMSREGVDLKVLGNFYKAVAQAVLLFGAETWVLTQSMERDLDSFQHRVARRITGKQPRRRADGIWEYPPLSEAMGEAGFEGIRKSSTWRQNTVAQYIAMRPILYLCERANRWSGESVSWKWWEQAGIDLEGAKKQSAEAMKVLESELESEAESDVESNEDSGIEEEYKGASGLSGAEWSGAEE